MNEEEKGDLKKFLTSKIKSFQESMNKSKKGFHYYIIDKAKRDMCKEVLDKLEKEL